MAAGLMRTVACAPVRAEAPGLRLRWDDSAKAQHEQADKTRRVTCPHSPPKAAEVRGPLAGPAPGNAVGHPGFGLIGPI